MATIYVLPLTDERATLEVVGGKGMSLARLSRAGLPVPDGFHITTEAYRRFVAENGLQPRVLAALEGVDPASPEALEAASRQIAGFFLRGVIPTEISQAITQAYAGLNLQSPKHSIENQQSVAVRSSATAEDLPEASFAGQQDTYLNIYGEAAVLEAVKKCWASLWTARAIAYRARQGIDPNAVALAVVVQELVNAESAGILFTVNPVTGRRDEMTLSAAWGLGEAIVGGLVTPDSMTVEKSTGRVLARQIAEKQVMTVRTAASTEEQPVPPEKRNTPVLSDLQAADLARLARQIEGLYRAPMDIEWALAGGTFFILQARPITALPEPPLEWKLPNPKGVYMRGSVGDLLPDPLSPLFISLGIPALRAQMIPLGERLTRVRPVFHADYFTSINDYFYMNATMPPQTWWWVLTGMLPAYPRLLRRLVPVWRDELHPEYCAKVACYQGKIPASMTAGELWRDVLDLVDAAMYYVCGLMFATMGASAGSEMLLNKIYQKTARQEGDLPVSTLLMGWDSIPVQAEKSLYDLAQWAQNQPGLAEYLLNTPTADLCRSLLSPSPDSLISNSFSQFASRLAGHHQRFGHIIFQLDFAADLPLDHPELALESIKLHLRGKAANPHERQQVSQEKRLRMAEKLLQRPKGLKRWAFRKALNWAQSLSEVREDALAEIGLAYPLLRAMLAELGGHFVKAGVLREAGDIYWLKKEEIAACADGLERGLTLEDRSAPVEGRKAYWRRLKQETPPPMMPVKERIMGIKVDAFVAQSADDQQDTQLKGVPASPGKITAPACVLHGPADFAKMKPGAVLVAGTTTPAWTPLFMMAAAVVTDIGGPLSHGSIVAREYGIPAVMGTGVATRRIRDGQTITVDGSVGLVSLLKDGI